MAAVGSSDEVRRAFARGDLPLPGSPFLVGERGRGDIPAAAAAAVGAGAAGVLGGNLAGAEATLATAAGEKQSCSNSSGQAEESGHGCCDL